MNDLSFKPMFPDNRPDVDQAPVAPKMSASEILRRPVYNLIDMEIAGMVNERFEASKTWRRPWRLVWDQCWRNMKGVYNTNNKAAWQSTTHQPVTSRVVEVITANLTGALLGPESPVEWQSKRADYQQLVDCYNDLMKTDMDKCQAKTQLTDFIRNLVIAGTSIGCVDYVKEWETVMIKQRQDMSQLDPQMASLGLSQNDSFIPQQMLVRDFANIRNVDLFDIYPQPRTPEITKDSWIIEKGKITNKELYVGSLSTDPYYRYDNVTLDLLEGTGSNRQVEQDPEKQTRRFALLDYQTFQSFLEPDREHDLKTFYGPIPLWYLQPELRKDDSRRWESVPGWIQVVDGQYVIRKRISPWRDGEPPYFKANYIRLPHEFYGIGAAELIAGLQIEKNEIRNSRMDNINLSMNKIIAVLKDMVPPGEWQRLKSEPGAIWLFKGLQDVRQAVQPIEFGNVTQDSWLASKEVDQEIQETTGAVKATLGVGGDQTDAGGKTFRGQLLNQQAATERFMLYARAIETMGLIPAFKKFYSRIYQFKDLKDVLNILGPERSRIFKFLSPEELEQVAKLVPLGVLTMENKGIKLAQMNQFTQQWLQFPFFKKLEMARKEWIEMGNPEPDQVLFSDEEMNQFNQMSQQLYNSAGNPGPLGMNPGMPGQPQQPQNPGLLGPNGQPIAGNTQYPMHGMPRPVRPAAGPGANRVDMNGRPLS